MQIDRWPECSWAGGLHERRDWGGVGVRGGRRRTRDAWVSAWAAGLGAGADGARTAGVCWGVSRTDGRLLRGRVSPAVASLVLALAALSDLPHLLGHSRSRTLKASVRHARDSSSPPSSSPPPSIASSPRPISLAIPIVQSCPVRTRHINPAPTASTLTNHPHTLFSSHRL